MLAWPRFEGRIEAAEGLAKQFARITVFALINTMSHTTRIPFVLAVVVGSILLGNAAIAKPAAERASYKEVIVPILRGRCYRCHSDAADNQIGRAHV